jgi:predicted ATPase
MPASTERLEKLRLRGVLISNFKALDNFELRLPTDLSILIGPNGAGKSSVIQALSFVGHFAMGRAADFFEEREQEPYRFASFFRTNRILHVGLLLQGRSGTEIVWNFGWGMSSRTTRFERLWFRRHRGSKLRCVVNYGRKESRTENKSNVLTVGGERLRGLKLRGSSLSEVAIEELDPQFSGVVRSVREWAAGIYSLELLSPTAMRRSWRGEASDIGARGEKLGGFLAHLPARRKARLVARLGTFYPALKSLDTVRRQAGWIDLKVSETFARSRPLSQDLVSDGFMRLLALSAIPEIGKKSTLVMLDEVEDGIDPTTLPKMVRLIAKESGVQLVLTSHSPLLVNMFEPENVIFIARSARGSTISAPVATVRDYVRRMSFRGVGEVWAHTSTETISKWVRAFAGSKSRFDASATPESLADTILGLSK